MVGRISKTEANARKQEILDVCFKNASSGVR